MLSIESQIKELKDTAARLKLNVPEILTESQSAKHPGRPIFNELMRKIYKGQVKGVIVWKLDRLARNPIDGTAMVWALDQGKITEIITPQQSFHNNSNDKFLMQLEFGMAKKYVDDLSDNVKRGNRAKLERGWLPGLPLLGYLNDPKERTIIIDPERFPLIRKMWDMLLEGVLPSRILDIANKQWGFRTRFHPKLGRKPLTIGALYKIFGSPFYYGLIERKDSVYIGKHTPMISEDEYWKAQEILGRKGRPRPKRHNFSFTGLIRCTECGCMITAEEKTKKSGRHYVYYRCSKKNKKFRCRQRYLNANDLEDQIIDSLSRIRVPTPLLDLTLGYLKAEEKEGSQQYSLVRHSLEQALSSCQRKLDNLNRMRLDDLIDNDEYLREKKRLLDEKIALTERLQNGDADKMGPIELTADSFIFAGQALDRFRNGSPEDKRDILREIGSNFYLKDGKLIIDAEKPLLIIAEGLKAVNIDNQWLEPLVNGLMVGENALSYPPIQSWLARIEDVRTFYEKSCEMKNSKYHA